KTFEELEKEENLKENETAELTEDESSENANKEKKKPKVNKKRDFTREDSTKFRGYGALFGIFSYEKSDTKRHVRLLPLTWLTWDEESDDKILVSPLPLPIVWYNGDDVEYNIIFPLYGRQKDESSEKQAYLINLFWKEDYKENNWKEYSIFWPLINKYNSDSISGHRILPFYIHKNYSSPKTNVTTNYSIFGVYSKEENKNSDFNSIYGDRSSTSFFFWPTLTYYSSNKHIKNDLKNNTSTDHEEYKLWVTPFFYRKVNGTTKRTNLLWFIDWKYHGDEQDYLLVFPFFKKDGFFFIFPITFTSYKGKFVTFTLFNYLKMNETGYYYNFLYLLESESRPNYSKNSAVFNAFKIENTKYEFESHGIWGFLWNMEKKKEVHEENFNVPESYWKEISFLWWLGGGYRTEKDVSQTYNFSLFFIHKNWKDSYINWTLGNYIDDNTESFYNNFLFLFEYENQKENSPGDTKIDLIFRTINYKNYSKEFYFKSMGGLLWDFTKGNEKWKNLNFLWLGYSNENDGIKVTNNYFPIYYDKLNGDSTTNVLGPFINYSNKDEYGRLDLGLAGIG
ncbi:MAG: hypothetical protein KDK36_04660, partial [Leptospiraceae bacterium]|nr:hypothetical protein [Leptospiraceae bacterium]